MYARDCAKTIARIHLFGRGWDPDAQSHDVHIEGWGWVYGRKTMNPTDVARTPQGLDDNLRFRPWMLAEILDVQGVCAATPQYFAGWVMVEGEYALMKVLFKQIGDALVSTVLHMPRDEKMGTDYPYYPPHIRVALASAAYVCWMLGLELPKTSEDLIALLTGETPLDVMFVNVKEISHAPPPAVLNIVTKRAMDGYMVVFQNAPGVNATSTVAEMLTDTIRDTVHYARDLYHVPNVYNLRVLPPSMRSEIRSKLTEHEVYPPGA